MKTVFLAGYGNSLDGHWQRHWFETLDDSIWVEQKSWEAPQCSDWVEAFNEVVSKLTEPFRVITHSLGGLCFLEWTAKYHNNLLTSVMLVAVPDPRSASFPESIIGFDYPQNTPLTYPGFMVISENDPYADLDYSQGLSKRLGIPYKNIGVFGHINGESGLGEWPEGLNMFNSLLMVE